jgi:hypothetical protein
VQVVDSAGAKFAPNRGRLCLGENGKTLTSKWSSKNTGFRLFFCPKRRNWDFEPFLEEGDLAARQSR